MFQSVHSRAPPTNIKVMRRAQTTGLTPAARFRGLCQLLTQRSSMMSALHTITEKSKHSKPRSAKSFCNLSGTVNKMRHPGQWLGDIGRLRKQLWQRAEHDTRQQGCSCFHHKAGFQAVQKLPTLSSKKPCRYASVEAFQSCWNISSHAPIPEFVELARKVLVSLSNCQVFFKGPF